MIPTDQSVPTIRGHVILPSDPAYDVARRSYNGMLDRRPQLIVRPVDAADVAATVRWAADAGLGVAVRGGGHSVAGHSIPDGACVIDLGGLRSVSVDPRTGTIEADGGCLLMDLDVASTAFGLAVPSGTFFDTGIGGLTLGGGISFILSSAGFTCDVLVGAELVTADGRIVQVDEEREPDLLWALRGGGGNFGVVTRFRYQATPVEVIQAGSLRFRGPAMAEVADAAVALDRAGPDELTTQLVLQRPAGSTELELRVGVTWRGDAASATPILAPLRGLPGLMEDGVRPMTWLQGQARNASIPPGVRHYWKGHLLGTIPPGFGSLVVEAAGRAPGIDVVLVELIHGLPHRTPAGSAAFGSSYPRLRAIKRTVDPGNLFRYNANIPPG